MPKPGCHYTKRKDLFCPAVTLPQSPAPPRNPNGRLDFIIDESEMNRIISVTSSSPAYVFAFIGAILEGARAQGLPEDGLRDAICDMVIGSAALLKSGTLTPEEQISVVASKGGTTERAIAVLRDRDMAGMVVEAMKACTARAEEMDRASKG